VAERHAIFLGSKRFGLSMLKALLSADADLSWTVIHPDDQEDARSALADFEGFCQAEGLAFMRVSGPMEANDLLVLRQAEFVFVCGWYWLLPKSVLACGSKFFGIHNSLLPKYRGGAPLVWAIMRGDARVGSSLFGITPGMDDGRLYLQVAVDMDENADIGYALSGIEQEFAQDLPRAWTHIVRHQVEGQEQDHSQATFGAQRVEADGLIDWERSARRVHDFVRAQTRPYPGAFTWIGDRKIRVWRTRIVPATHYGTPGQVISRRRDEVVVACGEDTALAVVEAGAEDGVVSLSEIFPSLKIRLGRRASEGAT
jgi:methionyl-tRNA formyltransferase